MVKRLFLTVAFVSCVTFVSAEELRPQFRAWKSSALQSGTYVNTLISTSPIIFHTVVGSPTVNIGGNSMFQLHRSTGNNGNAAPAFVNSASTKAIILFDTGGNASQCGLGIPYDVFSDSYTYFSKSGASTVNYLWDYYSAPPSSPYNNFPKD